MTINNLYVHYDDDGTAHHLINDREVSKDEWVQQHPHMRKGNDNGRNGSQDVGNVGDGAERVPADVEAEVLREGIRGQRAKAKAAEAKRARSSGDELG